MQKIFTAPFICPCWGRGRLHSVLSSFKVPGCTRLTFLLPLFAKARKKERDKLCTDTTGFFLEVTYMCSHITDQSKSHIQGSPKGMAQGSKDSNLALVLQGKETMSTRKHLWNLICLQQFCLLWWNYIFISGRSHYEGHLWAHHIKYLMRSHHVAKSEPTWYNPSLGYNPFIYGHK